MKKRIGYRLFQVTVVSIQVYSIVAAAYHGESIIIALVPSIVIIALHLAIWAVERWDKVIRVYKRLYVLPDLFRSDSFVLIFKPNEVQKNITIRTNYVNDKDVINLMAYTAIELNNSEKSIDSLTNELGIKRADE